jgi:ectoine hydroxylase-related dioxygenase (phytanoyl-CoA dioxygenase family)
MSSIAHPVSLSFSEQLASHQRELRECGWTLFPNAIAESQLAAGRAAIDELIASGVGIRASDESYSAVNLLSGAEVFRELALHALVLATMESFLGQDCILSSCNLAARRPGGGRQIIHRDTDIWGNSMPHLSIPVGFNVAWCFDDFTIENGATHAVVGSHLLADAPADGAMIQLTATAGSILAFDARMLHAGGANRSGRLRRAVFSLYIRSWLKPQTDHKRSFPRELIATTSPALIRLLGFQRQSPVEGRDGRTVIVDAPGATLFYGQAPNGNLNSAKY